MNGVVSRPGQRWLSSGGLTLIAQARPQDDGGHSCNSRVRCRIVSLDLSRFLISSQDALSLTEAVPGEQQFFKPYPSLLHFSTL